MPAWFQPTWTLRLFVLFFCSSLGLKVCNFLDTIESSVCKTCCSETVKLKYSLVDFFHYSHSHILDRLIWETHLKMFIDLLHHLARDVLKLL